MFMQTIPFLNVDFGSHSPLSPFVLLLPEPLLSQPGSAYRLRSLPLDLLKHLLLLILDIIRINLTAALYTVLSSLKEVTLLLRNGCQRREVISLVQILGVIDSGRRFRLRIHAVKGLVQKLLGNLVLLVLPVDNYSFPLPRVVGPWSLLLKLSDL